MSQGCRFLRQDKSLKQTASRDIDILAEFAPDKHTFDNFMKVSFLLDEILGRNVEFVPPEGLNSHNGPQIFICYLFTICS